MEDLKTCYKPAYKCAICDSVHDTVQGRMLCERACLKKQQEEEKKAAEAKKNAEKSADMNEASAALDNAFALVNKCVEKHGTFKYTGKLKELDVASMDFFPNKLFHRLWF